MRNWTDAQREAFTARGSHLLVSAAAGSGKTAVLVERIIRLVTEEKKDVDRILVVTFTRAAASQMKQRIGEALEALLEEHPEDEHLQRQSGLVHHAPISTIDSFCLDTVREYIHMTQLEPDFRMADPGEVDLLTRDVLDKLLEDKYAAEDPDFLMLADNFEPGRREGDLGDIVLRLMQYSQAYPYPQDWRHEAIRHYEADTPEKLEKEPWVRYIVSYLRAVASEQLQRLGELIAYVPDNLKNPEKGLKALLRGDQSYLEGIAAADSYEKMYRAVNARSSKDWGRMSKEPELDPAVYDEITALRKTIKEQFAGPVQEKYLSLSLTELADFTVRCAPCARALAALTDEFETRFTRAKRDKNMADFPDIEHEALQILWQKGEDGEGPTEAAAALAARYEEIMIDEYQDSNLVQETLLGAISREKHGGKANRFMVGDVKQSIYRFRQAMPELFMEKYNAYRGGDEPSGRCIELSSNFRSRAEVLEGVNMLFRQIMQPDIGGVMYDERAALHPGAVFAEGDDPAFRTNEIWIIDEPESTHSAQEKKEENGAGVSEEMPDGPLSGADISTDEREAALIGQAILKIVGKEKIWDEKLGTYRPVKFGDIALLQRSVTGHSDVYMQVLGEMGIPVYTDSGSGYFSAGEVRLVLDYLSILDNPLQNIPMAAVLRSPLGEFTDEEIARIYLSGTENYLWEKLMRLAEEGTDDKIRAFVERMMMLRQQMRELPLQELLWRILEGTHFLDYVSAMPSGDRRRANLDMLVEKAAAFEKGSYSGLFHFLRYVEHLRSYEIDYGEAPVSSSGEGSVQLMTIHKSKGLEFPIVIVAGLGRGFNTKEGSGDLVLHSELGLGITLIDPERHVKITSPIAGAIGRRALMDARGEEMRVLYVALTRAKEKLILVGSAKASARAKWFARTSGEDGVLPFSVRADAKNPLQLLVSGALGHAASDDFRESQGYEKADASTPVYRDGCGFSLKLLGDEALPEEAQEDEEQEENILDFDPAHEYDPERAAYLSAVLSRRYPWEDKAGIPGKVSVSYLKAEQYEKEQERIYQLVKDREEDETGTMSRGAEHASAADPAETTDPASPHRMGAAQRGSLIHQFMQYINYAMVRQGEDYAAQLEWLIKCGKIPDSNRADLPESIFRGFFASQLCRRMALADRQRLLFREQPFVLGRKARELKGEWDSDDTVLIQGIIDAWFIEDDEIVLLDYKTDRVIDGDEQSLVRKYKTQLDLYAEALERITQKKVKEKLIWSFALDRQIEV